MTFPFMFLHNKKKFKISILPGFPTNFLNVFLVSQSISFCLCWASSSSFSIADEDIVLLRKKINSHTFLGKKAENFK